MALSCIISELKRVECKGYGKKSRFSTNKSKNRDFFIPPSTPPLGGPRWSIAIPFDTEKLEWSGYPPDGGKNNDMFSRFDRIPACDGRTDGQTSCHGIVRAMHTRRAVKINKEIRQNQR